MRPAPSIQDEFAYVALQTFLVTMLQDWERLPMTTQTLDFAAEKTDALIALLREIKERTG